MYVLIVLSVIYYSPAVFSIDFKSQSSCEIALDQLNKHYANTNYSFKAICVPK
jgi:hypothetical protein